MTLRFRPFVTLLILIGIALPIVLVIGFVGLSMVAASEEGCLQGGRYYSNESWERFNCDYRLLSDEAIHETARIWGFIYALALYTITIGGSIVFTALLGILIRMVYSSLHLKLFGETILGPQPTPLKLRRVTSYKSDSTYGVARFQYLKRQKSVWGRRHSPLHRDRRARYDRKLWSKKKRS